MTTNPLSDLLTRLGPLLQQAKNTPQLLFVQSKHLFPGAVLLWPPVRGADGQLYRVAYLHPADVAMVREALRPHLHPLLGRMPEGLEDGPPCEALLEKVAALQLRAAPCDFLADERARESRPDVQADTPFFWWQRGI